MSYIIHAHLAHAIIATSFANGQERKAFIGIVYLILPMATVTGARDLTDAKQGIYKGIHGKKNLLAKIKDRLISVSDDGVPFARMNMRRLINILVDDDAAASDDDYWSSDSKSNSEKAHRRAQKGVFRGSNLGPRYLYTGLPYAPAEAGFVHGAPPPLWYRRSEVLKPI